MDINIITILALVAGFVAGVLVTRNNFAKVNKVVSDIDSKIDTLKADKKPAPRKRRGRAPKKTS
jgi:hypothetical protein